MKKKTTMNRREFLSRTSVAALSGALLGSTRGWTAAEGKSGHTEVVLIRSKKVLGPTGKPVAREVGRMLDEAVTTLTGRSGPREAWKEIIRPDDVVGIKTNVWRYLNTTPEVEQALKERVMEAGVAKKNIGIRDRGILKDPLFMKSTALINARPMRTHHWSGVGSLIKNYIMFVPDPYNYHGDSCADLGTIWKKPEVRGKTRLNILVMFTPQIHNVGPHGFNPRYLFNYYGLIAGFDPVACDSVGLKIIEAQRRAYFGEDRPLNPPARHIPLADTRHHLGQSNLEKIRILRMGYRENSLV